MNVLRAAIGVLGLALLGLIIWAAFAKPELHGGLLDQVAVMATLPWGKATLVDLFAGFILFAVIVFLTERSWIIAVLWAAPIFIIGNVWSALWLLIRLPRLAQLLSKPNWPGS
jgi:hypothetical protein